MELSQEEKDKLYELIDKLNPCVAIASKEVIERFKEWTEGKVKAFEIPDNDNFFMWRQDLFDTCWTTK